MYTSRVPSYVIDLEKDESERWANVIQRERKIALRLAEEARETFGVLPRPLIRAAAGVFGGLYRLSGGRYVDEARAWADALGFSTGEALLVNCTYELSHLSDRLFGCTAGIRWVEGLGMVHVRSMDWPMDNIGPATRIFRFREGDREFVSVGILGYLGVLSGMLPGAYSVTINWAPPVHRPTFDFGPEFLLREVLETCDTYDEAVEVLAETRLSTSVFFAVCGVERGQACVIERTRDDYAIREFEEPVLVQANHHVAECFLDNNARLFDVFDDEEYEDEEEGPDYEDQTLFDSSRERAGVLAEELGRVSSARRLTQVRACLNVDPVCNEDSYQQMVFCPAISGSPNSLLCF